MTPSWLAIAVAVAVAALAAAPGTARAADYYVDNGATAASDGNAGTMAMPWQRCPGMEGWSGSATLRPGDVVHFQNERTWSISSGLAVLEATGGVTYDGSSWGAGTRATFRTTGDIDLSVITFQRDDATMPTVVRGFEVDAGGQVNSGIAINYPRVIRDLTGATKRIEDCVVHGVHSSSAAGEYEYGIVVSSGYGGHVVSGVEIIGCTTYDISRGGVNVYVANDMPSSHIDDVIVRGCDIYQTGTDPDYAGSAFALKNNVRNVVVEFNYIHDSVNGAGIGVGTVEMDAGFTGPENAVIRHNIVTGHPFVGINFYMFGGLSADVYGNIIANNRYQGLRLMHALGPTALRIYNNTFVGDHDDAWAHEILIQSNDGTVSAIEVVNNLVVALAGTVPYVDEDGDVTRHANNLYYREGGGDLAQSAGTSYSASDVTTWEPTALTAAPGLTSLMDVPHGFAGTYGVDLQPNTTGLALLATSGARDVGADLGAAFATSINTVMRPAGAGWDIGAYEYSDGSPPPPPTDAGTAPGTDAGPGAPRADGGTIGPRPDGGTVPAPDDSGCGCRATGTGPRRTPWPAVAALALVALLAQRCVRRRRRRRDLRRSRR